MRLRSGRHVVEVAALANDLFRVGLFADGRPVDYRSEAVAKTEWPTLTARVSADGARVETSAAMDGSLSHEGLATKDTKITKAFWVFPS